MKNFGVFVLLLALVIMVSAQWASAKPNIKKIEDTPKIHAKPKTQLVLHSDLEVTSISMSPTNPVAGQNVTFSAEVKNVGKVNTPQVEAIFSFWDTQGGGPGSKFSQPSPPVPPLTPGQSHELKTTATFITLGDQAAVSVKVDKSNKIREVNESNNEKIHFFNVQCKPDLATYDYTKPKPANVTASIHPGEDLSLTVWVYNNGWCDSKEAKLSVGGDELWPVLLNIPPINPHQKVSFPITLKWDKPGTKNCSIKIDSTNTNHESIENNNETELKVFVLSDAWPE